MLKYYAAPGSPFTDEDARLLGPELQALAESGRGSPVDIVAYAREHETPLRTYLQMDRPLEEVAESWYRARAGKIARSIMVRVKTAKGVRDVRAFYSVVVAGPDPASEPYHGYVTIRQVKDSEAMSEQVLDQALEQLRQWRDRYWTYREVLVQQHPRLATVFEAVDRAVKAA